jgi:hypothetical protein
VRPNNKTNTRKTKEIARRKYAERQIDKWLKWSFVNRGKILYKDLVLIQNQYNIKCNG